MERIAFELRINADLVDGNDQAHRCVWPELLAVPEDFGVTDYSIFRRSQQRFLYMHVPDFVVLTELLATSEVNRRWQHTMAPLLKPVPDLEPGKNLATMREGFFMPGKRLGPEQMHQEKEAI